MRLYGIFLTHTCWESSGIEEDSTRKHDIISLAHVSCDKFSLTSQVNMFGSLHVYIKDLI